MSKKYVVGLPDAQGGMCWLAGYESDPFKERRYRVIPESEMHKYNLAQ